MSGKFPQRLARTELRALLILCAAFASIWAFVGIAGEVLEGDTTALDRAILLAFRRPGDPAIPLGPRWLQEASRDITALGGVAVLTLIVVAAVAWLVLHRRRAQALVFLTAVLVGQLAAELAKHLIGRARPDLVPHLDLVYSASFPSGHSTMSPIVYFTLAGIVAAGERRRSSKVLLLAGSVLLVLAIGVSRVYLGVHWPSDVLGGWTMGMAVALVATAILDRFAPPRPSESRVVREG